MESNSAKKDMCLKCNNLICSDTGNDVITTFNHMTNIVNEFLAHDKFSNNSSDSFIRLMLFRYL